MEIGKRFELFWKAFFSPEKVFAAEAKGKPSMATGVANNVLAFLVIPIVIILISALGPQANPASGVAIAVIALAGLLILSFIVAALYHFIASLLGGKGSVEKTYYLLSVYNAIGVFSYVVLAVLYLLAAALVYASPVAAVVALPVVLILIYTVMAYLFYVLGIAVRAAHQISSLRGIFSIMVAYGIVVVALLAVLFAVFGGVLLGALAGGRGMMLR